MSIPSDSASRRRWVYALLIVVALAGILGRILSVANVVEPHLARSDPAQSAAAILLPLAATTPVETAALLAAGETVWSEIGADEPARLWPRTRPRPEPTLGGNDRSRWATIRALVDEGTYVIGWRVERSADPKDYADYGIMTENGWQTLDKVLNPREHPLYEGEAYPRWKAFYSSKPPLLPTLLAGEYWLLRHGLGWSITDKDGRWLVVRTILITINWLPMLVYLVLLSRLAERLGTTDWGRLYVIAAGAFATYLTPFAIVLNNHTIAACTALFALYPALKVWEPALARGSRLNFLVAGLFAGFTATCELPAAAFLAGLFLLLLARSPGRTLLFFVPAALLPIAGLLLTNYLAIGDIVPAYSKLDSPWYQHEGGYWRPDPTKRGIDWAWQKEGKAAYAFHLLLGHHGLFSLTPIWLLALVGIALVLLRQDEESHAGFWTGRILGRSPGRGAELVVVSALTLFLTVVVLGFYLFVANRMSNNYGGMTSGPRWFVWLTPFWLLTLLPAADRLGARRWGRVLGYALLGLSVLSVSYPAWNPWRHPWLYNFFESQGWVRY
jgi:hypothetical protein